MGVVSEKCDNAKVKILASNINIITDNIFRMLTPVQVNLTMDWDGSPVNYTCYSMKMNYLKSMQDTEPIITCDTIPPGNYLVTYCNNQIATFFS